MAHREYSYNCSSVYVTFYRGEQARAYVLTNKGTLSRISFGYVLCNGSPLSEAEFMEERNLRHVKHLKRPLATLTP